MDLSGIIKSINKLVVFSFPLSINLLVNMIPNFAAILMASKLGKIKLAAGALAIITHTPIIMAASTMLYAVGISISHSRGKNKPSSDTGSIVRNGFWLALLLAIVAYIIFCNIDKVLILFKQDPNLIILTKDYFYFAGFSILPTLLLVVMAQFFLATENSKFILFVSLLAFPLTILFTYGFVLGKLGLPNLALGGITCATFIVQSLFCLYTLFYMFFKKKIQAYKIFSENFFPNRSICWSIFILGYPIGLQFGGEMSAMTIATYFLGHFGIIALVAGQIVSQYTMPIIVITSGLSQALALLIGEIYGSYQHSVNLIRQYIISAIIILFVFFGVILLLFLLKSNYFITLFVAQNDISSQRIINLSFYFFIISLVTLLIDGIRNLFSAVLRGLYDSRTPMKVGIYCLWMISLPVSYVVAFYCKGGPIGLRIGFISGFIVAIFILWKKIHNRIILIFKAKKRNISQAIY